MVELTEGDVMSAIKATSCEKCGTTDKYMVLGFGGLYCKCEAEELLKKPACKKAAEHMKKLYDDQISIAGGVAG